MIESGVFFSPQAAVYGMAQSIPDRTIVSEITGGFFDGYYSTCDDFSSVSAKPKNK